MEEKIGQGILYDFYGELLNEHQKRIYEDFVLRDLSLGEIAEAEGISRQGVHDLVRRCTRTLAEYEERLHLIAKFQSTKDMVARIQNLADTFDRSHDDALIAEIRNISEEILDII